MVDWYALLWVTEWRTVRDLRQVDITLKLPIWVGIIGLLASGALLQPDLGSPLTLVKLGAVLVLSLNGVAITRWTTSLARFPRKTRFSSLPRAARIRFITSAVDLAGRLVDRRRHRHAELHLLIAERRRRRRVRTLSVQLTHGILTASAKVDPWVCSGPRYMLAFVPTPIRGQNVAHRTRLSRVPNAGTPPHGLRRPTSERDLRSGVAA